LAFGAFADSVEFPPKPFLEFSVKGSIG